MNDVVNIVTVKPGANDVLEEIVALACQFEIEGVEEKEDEVLIYIKEELTKSKNWKDLESDFINRYGANIEHDVLEVKNWNAIWESEFTPITINDFAYIRAPFHEAVDDVRYDLVIQPKMSFGTGHHATTFSMMTMMQHLSLEYKSVLDLGSGTAVLGILAKKMGAEEVLALDNDEWCFTNGQENADLNDVGIEIVLGEINNVSDRTFDVILANINRNYFLEKMPEIANLLTENGKLLMSGFLKEDLKLMSECAEKNLIRLDAIEEKDGWLCLVGQKI